MVRNSTDSTLFIYIFSSSDSSLGEGIFCSLYNTRDHPFFSTCWLTDMSEFKYCACFILITIVQSLPVCRYDYLYAIIKESMYNIAIHIASYFDDGCGGAALVDRQVILKSEGLIARVV